MARKKVECGPPYELSTKYVLEKIWGNCKLCHECGNHSHWTGAPNGKGSEFERTFPIRINGKTYQVRRIIWASMGRYFCKNDRIVTKCPNPRCIAPELLTRRYMRDVVREAVAAGKTQDPQTRAKISAAKQAAVGKVTDEEVMVIYMDPRPSTQIAPEFDVSDSFVRAIKAGKVRQLALMKQNPFAGLIRSTQTTEPA